MLVYSKDYIPYYHSKNLSCSTCHSVGHRIVNLLILKNKTSHNHCQAIKPRLYHRHNHRYKNKYRESLIEQMRQNKQHRSLSKNKTEGSETGHMHCQSNQQLSLKSITIRSKESMNRLTISKTYTMPIQSIKPLKTSKKKIMTLSKSQHRT